MPILLALSRHLSLVSRSTCSLDLLCSGPLFDLFALDPLSTFFGVCILFLRSLRDALARPALDFLWRLHPFFLRSLRDAFAIITASQSPPPLHPPDFDLGVRQTHRSRSPRSRLDLLSLCCGPSFDTASQSHRRTQIPIAAAVLPRDRLAVPPPADVARPTPNRSHSRPALALL